MNILSGIEALDNEEGIYQEPTKAKTYAISRQCFAIPEFTCPLKSLKYILNLLRRNIIVFIKFLVTGDHLELIVFCVSICIQ